MQLRLRYIQRRLLYAVFLMFIFHEYFAAGDAGITQYTQRKSKYPNNLKEKVI